jgi:hypothetical protein
MLVDSGQLHDDAALMSTLFSKQQVRPVAQTSHQHRSRRVPLWSILWPVAPPRPDAIGRGSRLGAGHHAQLLQNRTEPAGCSLYVPMAAKCLDRSSRGAGLLALLPRFLPGRCSFLQCDSAAMCTWRCPALIGRVFAWRARAPAHIPRFEAYRPQRLATPPSHRPLRRRSQALRTFDRLQPSPPSARLPAQGGMCAAQAINRTRDQRALSRRCVVPAGPICRSLCPACAR